MTMPKMKLTAEPGEQQLVLTRVFDAPRELVFRAFTDPELIPQWWGPRRYTTTIDKMDVRPGGSWRFVHRGEDGQEFAFRGVYHEITPPERIVWTFEFEGMPGHISLDTAVFEEEDGKTRLTATSVFQSVQDRDGMIQSGMEEGAAEGYDRLDDLLAKLEGPSKTRH
jgi:uncharacterized protein YndB with AHSA1/START domain